MPHGLMEWTLWAMCVAVIVAALAWLVMVGYLIRECWRDVKRGGAFLLLLLLIPAAANAQQHADVVAEAKNKLIQKGEDLTGICGGFKIVNATAWLLRGEGAGVYFKPGGTNCVVNGQGYSGDTLAYNDGRTFDILQDSEGAQRPEWNQNIGPNPTDAALWRPATDPGFGSIGGSTLSSGGSTQPPIAQAVDWATILDRLESLASQQRDDRAALERIFADLQNRDNEKRSMLTALNVKLTAHDNEPSWLKKVVSNRYVQIIGGAVAAWYTQKAVN